ncbi:hypothetical protein GAS19_11670 [Burkholderia glumae]|uniref:hypothetical protein n=1 Tax=Burkholderia glumae TaxID=337 RepID=UPI00129559A0|nr:hypothetical protein [Burkholderia glumae]QGA38208.1 hypothetical protein GAS19_11670 [Burkholderia glumae]
MTPASIDSPAIPADKRGLAPAKAIENDEAPLTRRKPVQTSEAPALSRQGATEHIDALRSEIRSLVAEITHAADVSQLDLMVDKNGCYARHNAVQEARSWATAAGITLETGLMQIQHAIAALESSK